jgi:hypothetical protein
MNKNVLFKFIRQFISRLLNRNYIFKILSDGTITYCSRSKELFNYLFHNDGKLINKGESCSPKFIIYSYEHMHLSLYNIKKDNCNYLVKDNVTWGPL